MTLQEFTQEIINCQPLRKTVQNIDIEKTAVVTFTELIPEAVDYFQHTQQKFFRCFLRPNIPTFVLIDWEGENSEKIKEIYKSLQQKVTVYPFTKLEKLPQKEFCLYAQDKFEFWRPNGILPLVSEYHKKNFPAFCSITANVYNKFGKGYPWAPYIEQRLPEAFIIYNHLADEESKKVFLYLLKAYATGDPDYLPLSPYPQYKHPIVSADPTDKVIIDGGALNGSSSIDFCKQSSPQTQILAFEAVPSLYEQCIEAVKEYPNITIVPFALWNKKDKFFIENNQGGSFITQTQTEKSETCYSIPLQDYYAEKNIQDCSLIKLDIEGAEPECLQGAETIIRQYKPKLQISIYHKIEQFFDIPLMLMSKYPDYKFYLGHHTTWFWETILYAVK